MFPLPPALLLVTQAGDGTVVPESVLLSPLVQKSKVLPVAGLMTATDFISADDVLPPKPGMFVLFGEVTSSVRLVEFGAGLVCVAPPHVVDVPFERSYVTRYCVTPSPPGAGRRGPLPSGT